MFEPSNFVVSGIKEYQDIKSSNFHQSDPVVVPVRRGRPRSLFRENVEDHWCP